jgi:hypothetical protein
MNTGRQVLHQGTKADFASPQIVLCLLAWGDVQIRPYDPQGTPVRGSFRNATLIQNPEVVPVFMTCSDFDLEFTTCWIQDYPPLNIVGLDLMSVSLNSVISFWIRFLRLQYGRDLKSVAKTVCIGDPISSPLVLT